MLKTLEVHNFGLFRTVSSYIAFRLQHKFKTVIKNFNSRGRGALKTLRDKRQSHLNFEKICRYQNPASRTFLVMLNARNLDLPDLHELYDPQMIDLDVSQLKFHAVYAENELIEIKYCSQYLQKCKKIHYAPS